MKSFIKYFPRQILLEWWNRGGWVGVCSTHGRKNAHKVLVRKPEVERPPGRPRSDDPNIVWKRVQIKTLCPWSFLFSRHSVLVPNITLSIPLSINLNLRISLKKKDRDSSPYRKQITLLGSIFQFELFLGRRWEDKVCMWSKSVQMFRIYHMRKNKNCMPPHFEFGLYTLRNMLIMSVLGGWAVDYFKALPVAILGSADELERIWQEEVVA
jgi:hypothetical protein